MKKKNQLLFSVAICCLSLFVVTNLSTVAEEETGTSAVPYYESKPKPPMPKPQPSAMQPPVRKPGVSSIGRIKVPPPSAASNGVIYAIADNGDLLWFRHDGRGDGSFRWTDNNARKVGVGWNMKHVFSGGDGVIYAIADNGDLMWFRHDGRGDGSFKWAASQGKKVGIGWGEFKQVFSGGDGVIYGVTINGDLMWYRHDGRADGSFRWAAPQGKKVGIGWNMQHVFSG